MTSTRRLPETSRVARTSEVRRETQLIERLLLGALIGLAGAAPVVVLALLVRAGYTPIANLDGEIARDLNAWAQARPDMVSALELVDKITSPWSFRILVFTLAAVLWRYGRRRLATWAAVTMAVGGALGVVLKLVVGRARPVFDEPVSSSAGMSFPSGHALNSMLGTVLLVWILLPLLGRRGRIVAGTVGSVVVALTAFDRVALGVHFLTDVLAGWVVAVALVGGTATAFGAWRRHHPGALDDAGRAQARRTDRRIRRLLGELGALLGRGLIEAIAMFAVMVGLGLLVTEVLIQLPAFEWLQEASQRIVTRRDPVSNAVSNVFSTVADTPNIIAGTAVAVAVLRVRCGRWREGAFVVFAVVLQSLVFVATQFVIARSRPDVEQLDPAAPTSSFPSGHTSAAIALYGSLALLLFLRARGGGTWSPALRAGAVLLALVPILVAWSRLYRGLHFPLDIAGSVVQAAFAIAVAARLVLRARLTDHLAAMLDRRPIPVEPAIPHGEASPERDR